MWQNKFKTGLPWIKTVISERLFLCCAFQFVRIIITVNWDKFLYFSQSAVFRDGCFFNLHQALSGQ